MGREGRDDLAEALEQSAQPLAHRGGGVGVQAAGGDEGEPRPLRVDDPPARVAEAGIDAENANR